MIYELAARNAILNALLQLVNGGTVVLQTSGGTTLGTFTLSSPCFSSVTNGVGTLSLVATSVVASGSGTANKALFKDSGGTLVFTCSVGLTDSGADITMASLVIASGEPLTIASATITQPTGA